MKPHYALLFSALALSGCCHGQWCLGAVGDKKPGLPPAVNNDDRTNSVDPRVTSPAVDFSKPEPEKPDGNVGR